MLACDLSMYPFRPVPIRRHVSWRLAAWGSPLPCSTILLSVQRARVYNEHRKLTRGALNRQNLARTRYSPSERRNGYFKQPTQRLYNYWEKSITSQTTEQPALWSMDSSFKGVCLESVPWNHSPVRLVWIKKNVLINAVCYYLREKVSLIVWLWNNWKACVKKVQVSCINSLEFKCFKQCNDACASILV